MNVETGKKTVGVCLIVAMVLKFIDLFGNIFEQSKYSGMTLMTFLKFIYGMLIDLLPIFSFYVLLLGVEKLIEQVEKNNKLTNENFKLIRNGITGNSGNHYDDNYKGSMLQQALDNMESNTIVPPRKRCPECNTYCKSDALYCPGCGKKLE